MPAGQKQFHQGLLVVLESAVKLSPEDPPSLRGYLGYLAMESDRNIRFRYLGDLPAKLGSVRFDAYSCLKVLFFVLKSVLQATSFQIDTTYPC